MNKTPSGYACIQALVESFGDRVSISGHLLLLLWMVGDWHCEEKIWKVWDEKEGLATKEGVPTMIILVNHIH